MSTRPRNVAPTRPKPAPKRPVAAKQPLKTAPASQSKKSAARSAGAPVAKPAPAKRVLKRAVARPTPGSKLTSVAASPRPAAPAAAKRPNPVLRVLSAPFRALASLISGKILGIAAAVVLVLVVAGVVVANSPVFAATDIVVNGTEHVPQETVERLVRIPDGTTLFNVDVASIESALSENPWVSGVSVERQFPHTLVITPTERSLTAIVYITADDVAWAVGDDGAWIAPVSLAVTVDAAGTVVDDTATDGVTATEGTQQLTGVEAARVIARQDGALLFTDVPADVEPSSGAAVDSEVILAGLSYARGFSEGFRSQIQSMSLASVDAITAYLDSGVEIALGAPEDIETKELVVTRLLEQEQGVTYINVRTPDNYTFRAAPTG